MALKNTPYSYGSVAKTFHWIIALLIIGLLALGFIMRGMDMNPDKLKLYGLHKSFGITVLTLALLRLAWKMINAAPQLPASLSRLDTFAAQAGHWFLYALMIAMPLSGWAMSSAAGFHVSVFGLFTLPDLMAPDKALRNTLVDAHGIIAWVIIGMVSLHASAALLHHFYYKNNVLIRMLPFTKENTYAQDLKTNENSHDTMAGC